MVQRRLPAKQHGNVHERNGVNGWTGLLWRVTSRPLKLAISRFILKFYDTGHGSLGPAAFDMRASPLKGPSGLRQRLHSAITVHGSALLPSPSSIMPEPRPPSGGLSAAVKRTSPVSPASLPHPGSRHRGMPSTTTSCPSCSVVPSVACPASIPETSRDVTPRPLRLAARGRPGGREGYRASRASRDDTSPEREGKGTQRPNLTSSEGRAYLPIEKWRRIP